ncbi:MAG: hypothetical protein EA374_02740 [Acholeplasmatales bacterium]|nr:MAG: hypothetical protein EA374_02740 [Acholeplasmatales bacterium]
MKRLCLLFVTVVMLSLVYACDPATQEPQVTLVNITMETLPTTTSYVQHEALDLTGASIRRHYSDGTSHVEAVTPDMLNTVDTSQVGQVTVVVTVEKGTAYAKTTSFIVTITPAEENPDAPIKIIFDSQGGSAVASLRGDTGTPAEAPVPPIREGYVFAGWYTHIDALEPYVFTKLPDVAVTVYADWGTAGLSYEVISDTNTLLVFAEDLEHLVQVEIPKRMDGLLVTDIGMGGFAEMPDLAFVKLSQAIQHIGGAAFYGSSSLTHLHLPASVETLNDTAFLYTYGMETFTVDEANPHFKTIDGILFSKDGKTLVRYPAGRDTVTTYELPNHVEVLFPYAFSGANALTEIILNDGLKTISWHTFYEARGLESIAIPNSVTTLAGYAFRSASGLKSVTFGSGLASIGANAFYSCNALTEVTLPPNITFIGYAAFSYAYNLRRVVIMRTSTTDLVQGSLMMFNNTPTDLLIYFVNEDTLKAYETAQHWSGHKSKFRILND